MAAQVRLLVRSVCVRAALKKRAPAQSRWAWASIFNLAFFGF
jgi:hypothetical protein